MSLLTLGKGTVLWIDQEHLHVLPNYTYFQLSFWFTTIQENIVIKRFKKIKTKLLTLKVLRVTGIQFLLTISTLNQTLNYEKYGKSSPPRKLLIFEQILYVSTLENV